MSLRYVFSLAIALLALVVATVPVQSADPVPAPAAMDPDVQDLLFLGDPRPVLIRLHFRIDGQPFPAAYQQASDDYLKQLFVFLDRDEDGFLSEAEAERAPAPQIPLAPGIISNRPESINIGFNFRVLDDNGDGKVSAKELAEYYRQYGSGMFHIQFDYRPSVGANLLDDALIKKLDADEDGKLSKKELAGAAAVHAKLDLDDDEMVTAEELVLAPRPARARPPRLAIRPDEFPLVAITPGDSSWPRRLLARYGSPGTEEAERKLTRADLGLDELSFNRLDGDKDGKLGMKELAGYAKLPPDVELVVRLGKHKDGEVKLEVINADRRPAGGPSMHPAGKNSISAHAATTQLDFRFQDIPSGDFAASVKRFYQDLFRNADADENGTLDKGEANQNLLLSRSFALLDRNADDKLSEKEILAYLDSVLLAQARTLAGRPTAVISGEGRGLFDLLDRNRDGRLSLREMREAGDVVAAWDKDRDGGLSREELPTCYQLLLGRGQAVQGRFGLPAFAVLPPGGPGAPAELGGGPLWFRKMDRNLDGDISLREFLGTPDEFKKLDTDGDGLINMEEAERADAAMRKPSNP